MSRTLLDLSIIERSYSGLLIEHGTSPRSVGYKDAASQTLRFEKLVQLLPSSPAQEPYEINELGCGYGAFYQFLLNRPNVLLKHYRGYDISEEMLRAARNYLPQKNVELMYGSEITTPADYCFISGIFSVKLDNDDKTWDDYVKQTLLQTAAMSKRGFAFYILSSYVDWKNDQFYYADPTEYFDFCKSNISPYVSLIHDYPLYEWTMLVRTGEAVK